MAWIESHQELGRHPKTKRLARQLDISLPAAVGYLQFLWWWAMDYAPDGDLKRYDDGDLADAALWDGDAGRFVEALTYAGFLNPDRTIHDWHDYAGRLIETRSAASKGGARGNHERWHVSRGIVHPDCPYCRQLSPPESPPDSVPDLSPDRVLSHTTQHNTTEQNQGNEDTAKIPPAAQETTQLATAADEKPTPQQIVGLWNEILDGVLPKVRDITVGRVKHLRARCAKPGRDLEWWRAYFQRIRASPFLIGENDRGWNATFDWVTESEEHLAKIVEGQYSNRGRPRNKAAPMPGPPKSPEFYASLMASKPGGGDGGGARE